MLWEKVQVDMELFRHCFSLEKCVLVLAKRCVMGEGTGRDARAGILRIFSMLPPWVRPLSLDMYAGCGGGHF